MKKIISIGLLFICLSGYTQVKDTTNKDTSYVIVLKKVEFENLVRIIKSLDEKPSIINKWLEENVYKKTKIVLPPKEQVLNTKKK